MQPEDMDKLPYLEAVMRETLRFTPPTSARSVHALEKTTLGDGKYDLDSDVTVIVHVWIMQRDPAIWGEDACNTSNCGVSCLLTCPVRQTNFVQRECWMENLKHCL